MKKYSAILAMLLVSACEKDKDSAPLIFGQGTSVGISVGPSTANAAAPEIAVGVKLADVAVVPTTVPLPRTPKDEEEFKHAVTAEIFEARRIRGSSSSQGQDVVDEALRTAVAGAVSNILSASISDEEKAERIAELRNVLGKDDSLSTFGSFSNETSSNCVKLGVFFATGVAAQTLSEGFKKSLSNGSGGSADCPTPSNGTSGNGSPAGG